jgi:hypothetical protein
VAAPYILAHRLSDAHRFAQDELGVPRGYYRIVTSPSTIRGPIGADLYVVPGWERRFDRFSMKTAMRFTRLRIIDVAEWRKEQGEAPDERYPNDERTHEIALRYNALRELAPADGYTAEDFGVADDLEPAGVQTAIEVPEQPEAAEETRATEEEHPAEAPKRVRRRRCPECGVLVDPDEVEQHAAEHLPEEV